MTVKALQEKGLNLNTLLLILSLSGGIITAVWFIEPLRSLPADMQGVQEDVHTMKNTQAVQTEALKTLAEVAKDSRELRRDLDHNSALTEAKDREHDRELDGVQKRLERIESH